MPSKLYQVHVRFPDDVVILIDEYAKKMGEDARQISPGLEFSRGDAVQAIVTRALMSARAPRDTKKGSK